MSMGTWKSSSTRKTDLLASSFLALHDGDSRWDFQIRIISFDSRHEVKRLLQRNKVATATWLSCQSCQEVGHRSATFRPEREGGEYLPALAHLNILWQSFEKKK